MKKLQLWQQIVIAIILGALLGIFLPGYVPYISFLGQIFLRLLKMLIAPLVLTTLISGVCKMGDVNQLKTVGIRIVAFYVATSAISAAIGMAFALVSQPGKGVTDLLTEQTVEAAEYSFLDNFISWIPTNIFESLSTGNTLQIIVFAIMAGVILLMLGEHTKDLVKLIEQGADMMLKMTEVIMKFSPIGIFALIAEMMTTLSSSMLMQVLNMIITDYVACIVVIFIMQALLVKVLAKVSPMLFFKKIAPSMIVAASTTSSAATLPVSIDLAKKQLGVSEKVYGFTLPLGNTCNMNGMAVAIGVISVFASNLYGFEITRASLVQFVFMGLVLSIGAAGVKGAGIVMSTVLLQTLGMPLTLVPILAAIWPVIDIPHTTANITGDLAGTLIVAKSVNEIDEKVLYNN